MKFFTPALLARCCSSDDGVAEAAADQWEEAVATYNARLKQIRSELPLGARQLLKHVSLHDAQCLLEGGAGKELSLTFRLAKNASATAEGVELRYLNGRAKRVLHKTQKADDGPSTLHVLYDEFDLEQKRGLMVFSHALLMTNGLEFQIEFSNLRLRWFGTVALADSKSWEMEATGRSAVPIGGNA